MHFILQDVDEIETFQMKKILENSHQDTYDISHNLHDTNFNKLKNSVPIGDLDFVRQYLDLVYINSEISSNEMPPIEIPICLRTNDITKRDYNIVNGKYLPKNGRYFIKDASELKNFSFNGNIEYVKELINPSHNYVLSSIVDILSEYRVIVLNDTIQAIQYYDGNPVILPDANFIQSIVIKYMVDNTRPKSYIADFGVNSNNETFLIELQPSVSFGTYGYYNENLKYIYKFGLDYYIDLIKNKD